MDLALVNI